MSQTMVAVSLVVGDNLGTTEAERTVILRTVIDVLLVRVRNCLSPTSLALSFYLAFCLLRLFPKRKSTEM